MTTPARYDSAGAGFRLQGEPDPAILRLARALGRQMAREDHAREMAERESREEGNDLRAVFDRPAERKVR
jgi:hypothetical protein